MDNTIKEEQIQNVLRNFDRQKHQEVNTRASLRSLEVVSAIGTDTPLTVLVDIRQLLIEVSNEARQNRELLLQSHELNQKHHRESLGYLQQLSDDIRSTHQSAAVQLPMRQAVSNSQSSGDAYYYRGDEIKTTQSLVGCILLHIDAAVSKLTPIEIGSMDTTVMELKDWTAAVRILKDADSSMTPHTGVLKLPNFNSTESRYSLNIVANPVQGRVTVCKLEHISDIVTTCPGIMNCVEEIRLRILECPGIISATRAKRLASVSYPFVTIWG